MKRTINNVFECPSLKKVKIVWLSSLVFGSDTVVSRTEMVKHLSKRGVDVRLFGIMWKGNYKRKPDTRFILFPMKFVSGITPLLYNLALLVCMPFYMGVKNPDYIITDKHTTISGFVLKLLMRPLRFRIVLDIRSTPLVIRDTFREHLDALLFRISVILAKKKFDGITIITELMKKEICSGFNISPDFVGVWSSGVSVTLFNPENFNEKEIRMSLGLDDNFVIFYHGSLRMQGLVETIQAIKMVKIKHPNVMLFLLGGTLDRSVQLRSFAAEIGVQNSVIIHGKVDYTDVPKYIAMCDLAIVPLPDSPNWRHQCALKLLEYLAMKKVVIVTDIPANREVIGKSKCGIYIASVDPEEIAKALTYSYSNRERLEELGSFGRAIVKKRYTWEKIAEDFENYLQSIMISK